VSLDHDDVREIVALLDDMNATELHLRTRHYTLTLRRTGAGGEWVQALSTVSRPAPAGADPVGGTGVDTPAAGTGAGAAATGAGPAAAGARVPAGAGLDGAAAAGGAPQAGAGPGRGDGGGPDRDAEGGPAGITPAGPDPGGTTSAGPDPGGITPAGPDPGGTTSAGPDPASDPLVAVRAPLMGTFYRAPKPGDAPFVDVGTLVGEETVVGIVETMKLMNSVSAGVRGRVAEICLANADFAAMGAVLMRIAPE
jgi:acetyl-CoA carboxylase biotin carboxyl carrier protein